MNVIARLICTEKLDEMRESIACELERQKDSFVECRLLNVDGEVKCRIVDGLICYGKNR